MSSNGEQAKRAQKRRERKQQERAARAKAARLPPRRGRSRAGMSVTLVEFAQPLLSRLSEEETTPLRWKEELLLATLVWNGVVYGDPGEKIVAEAVDLLPRADLAETVSVLMERKRSLFPDDDRCVLGLDTYERGGRVHVVAASAR